MERSQESALVQMLEMLGWASVVGGPVLRVGRGLARVGLGCGVRRGACGGGARWGGRGGGVECRRGQLTN